MNFILLVFHFDNAVFCLNIKTKMTAFVLSVIKKKEYLQSVHMLGICTLI